MESDSPEKQKRISEKVRSIILQSSEQITQNIQVTTGRISDTKIKKIDCFTGAGGKTYVIEATLCTALAGIIDGGIVIKFAKDLETEVENAKQLSELLKTRQIDWENWKNNYEVPHQIKRFPDQVFAPQVIHVLPEVQALILEFLSGFTPLLQFGTEPADLWGYAGYSLARLHGPSKKKPANTALYKPLMKVLSRNITEEFLNYWMEILEQSNGGVDYIHGDSHMSNILISPGRIAWIDAILLPGLDRMDDVAYIISHAVQEHVARNFPYITDYSALIHNITRSWVPLILSTYKLTYDISQIYSRLPLDFFLGSHLIIRAGLWEQEIAQVLTRLGQNFIYEMPVSKMLEAEG